MMGIAKVELIHTLNIEDIITTTKNPKAKKHILAFFHLAMVMMVVFHLIAMVRWGGGVQVGGCVVRARGELEELLIRWLINS
jgi:hypothetical protein